MTTARTAAVLTVSDSSSRGERADVSGPATAELLRQHGFEVAQQEIVPDDQPTIEAALLRLAAQVQLIVTTGGTGIAARDITPEATRAVCSKLIDGIPEKMRSAGLEQTPFAVLSRGLCGIRGQALILNLPGNPQGAVQSLEAVIDILPHAVDLLAGKTEHDHEQPA
ncbi:MAG: MogA/MoaB family molybdenum cofactor biosynthesis protein [Candidatus Korobacteraceae bacterium]